MASSRKKKLQKLAGVKETELAVAPTPETARKLRRDMIGVLLIRGRLTPEQARAAEEIRTVQEAVGRGMFRTSRLDPGASFQRKGGAPRDFLDRMTEDEHHLWQRHYLPWTRELALDIAAGIPGTRWLELVTAIVIDNTGLREIEQRYGLRHGRALSYLAAGLDRYNAIAGN
jgi:hypothetical protein